MAADPQEHKIGETVQEITQRTTAIVREEIELAKVELTEKATRIGKAVGVGAAAAVFVIAGLLYLLHGVAWLFNDKIFNSTWLGFFLLAVLLFILGAVAGFMAYRFFKKGTPPKPSMAIAEAQLTKSTLQGLKGKSK